MLVLSLFPGIGVLDRGFEEEGFVVVRGPDLLWGGDIRGFHPPVDVFDGVLGGPPCQHWTALKPLILKTHGKLAPDLIPEYVRVVNEAQPRWFVMENVITAPIPQIDGYHVDPTVLDNRWLGPDKVQSRKHRFSFGSRNGARLHYETSALLPRDTEGRVCASESRGQLIYKRESGVKGRGKLTRMARRSVEYTCELQGLPTNFFKNSPFRIDAQLQMLGNAVSLPMARALARAVREAVE